MTRKHYEAIAEIIRRHKEDYEMDNQTLQSVMESMATVFNASNDRFDSVKFYKACGYDYSEIK
jgi:hypothetical protein